MSANAAGRRVRADDVHGTDAAAHDAGAPSSGILKFIREVVRGGPPSATPPKPDDFPGSTLVETYPGHSAADVHFEGRAADIYLDYTDAAQRPFGDWLFEFCVAKCETYQRPSGADLPHRQLPPDAESVNSRRRSFPRIFPRVFAQCNR
jgi:hypothetical protein